MRCEPKLQRTGWAWSVNDSYQAVPDLANWLELSDCLGFLAPRPVLVHWGKGDNDPATRSAAFNDSSLTRRFYRLVLSRGEPTQKAVVAGPRASRYWDPRPNSTQEKDTASRLAF